MVIVDNKKRGLLDVANLAVGQFPGFGNGLREFSTEA